MARHGRPARSHRFPVWLTPGEDRVLGERAREGGVAVARSMREVALGQVPNARPNHLEQEVIRQRGRIGNNLNQLAYIANRNQALDTERELREVQEEVLAAARRLA